MAGNIRKLGERRYYVRITLGYDENGKRNVHAKVIHGTKKEAESYLTAKLREQDLGCVVESPKASLGAYLARWLKESAKQKVRDRTFSDYTEIVDKRIRPRLGGIALEKLTPLAIQTFYNELAAAGLSAKTIRNTHVVLRVALKQAVRWRLLNFNPAADVDLPRRAKKEMAALDTEQAARFITAARETPRGIIYLVALATGLRPQEYLALRWPDVDLTTGSVRVQRTIYWPRGGGWRFEETKTATSRRTVIIPGRLLPALREHRRQQVEQRLKLGDRYLNNDLVFANELGGPLEKCNLNKRLFKKILAAAGLPETLRPYDLRHSCATLLLERGENPKIVAERLGHASTVMTMDVYSHVTPTMQQAAADKLDALF